MANSFSSNLASFDQHMIARYDIPGPRYTSYPTAPLFHAGFGEEQWRAAVDASNRRATARSLSLYVHVPFCASPCFYCGCARIITRDHTRADLYLDQLEREIILTAARFDRDRRVEQLHQGGGTPNFLDIRQMRRLLQMLDAQFTLSDSEDREFGIEIDARYADADYIRQLAALGFNRLSLGIQDFDADVQTAVNRIQSFEQTRDAIEAAREAGFRSISVDLIYGLPLQTPTRFAHTLDQVIELAPDRIAAYGYAHLPERFRAQRRMRALDIPDAAMRLELLALTVERLTELGYQYIGLDHFARPQDELVRALDERSLQRNFQGYSTHAECDLIGLGMTAVSHIGDCFSQNAKTLPDYYAAIDADRLPLERGLVLSDDDIVRADAIQQLMCHGELAIDAFQARHAIDFQAYFAAAIQRLHALAQDDLVEVDSERIRVLPMGRFLLRIIAMCFDAHLTSNPLAQVSYSRAV